MDTLRAPKWTDYELIDCGNFEKLERFGKYILIRPEPQALWDKKLTDSQWRQMADARYKAQSSTSGEWERYKEIRTPWQISFPYKQMHLNFILKFTTFKHLGVFPEQAANWMYVYDFLEKIKADASTHVLNLFAYTGGASLAAKSAGADVIHLDSIKQVVNWSRENMESSGLSNIRWVVEDAMKFVEREYKRGRKYKTIIMDPPSYGLGPKGERWKLEEHLNEMLKMALSLLDPHQHCFILNTYSLNLSPLVLKNLINSILPSAENVEVGELFTESREAQQLPLGSYLRFQKF